MTFELNYNSHDRFHLLGEVNEDGDYQAINLVAIPITCCDPILYNSSMNDEKMYAVKQL
jgi:hypothetical protein